ncbi:MAG TPA: propanediol utilization protein [Clostridiales bacterium]|nr:propanediol utilization protein [Clostridiales bacterium]
MEKKILVETSARHVHLSREDLDILFGKGAELTLKKALSQPGQFACEERVDLVGPKNSIKGVSILGPVRPVSRVEVSLSDARTLGISAPVRESGDIAGTPGVKLVGPAGEVELKEGLIAAKRHIHMTPATAAEYGLKDKQTVKVAVEGERKLIFDEVVVRVSEKFAPAMHIDTDESNAASVAPGCFGVMIDSIGKEV